MNHISDKRSSSDRTSASHYFSDAQVPVTRLKNFIDELAEEVSSGHTQVSTDSMAQTDALFAIEVIIDYLMHRAVTSQTREKKHSSVVCTVRLCLFRCWKRMAAFIPQPEPLKCWGKPKRP